MPWSIEQGRGCPPSRPWAVVNRQSGEVEGCHATQHDAQEQQAALYAKEPPMQFAHTTAGQDAAGQHTTGRHAAGEERPASAIRSVPFELAAHGDGLTLEGYAAVFNTPTRIQGWEGEFDEVIRPGAFMRTLREHPPVLMFEHGRHPLLGSLPLGVIHHAGEDANGLYINARLTDNWLIQPVRDAIRDGAVDGMSFRFTVPDGGERWTDRTGTVPLRTLTDIDVPELGPVVFPAYTPTTASIRSLLAHLPEVCDLADFTDFTGRPDARSAGGGDPAPPAPPGTTPGNGGVPSPFPSPSPHARARDRALRMRRIIRG